MSRLPALKRSTLPYTALFCEENIWQLARILVESGFPSDRLWVLFFSNAARQVALRRQRAGGEGGLVVWDYHVVLQARDDERDLIYDFDTTLPFPSDTRRYVAETFPDSVSISPALRGRVRRIPAAVYLHRFHSDRSHMAGMIPEERFPKWPAITPEHPEVIALRRYWDMERELDDGSGILPIEAIPIREAEIDQGEWSP